MSVRIQVPKHQLRAAAAAALRPDVTRPQLQYIHFRMREGVLNMVATNGHFMMRQRLPKTSKIGTLPDEGLNLDPSLIPPGKPGKFPSMVSITFGVRTVKLKAEDNPQTSEADKADLGPGLGYPDWWKVWPEVEKGKLDPHFTILGDNLKTLSRVVEELRASTLDNPQLFVDYNKGRGNLMVTSPEFEDWAALFMLGREE